MDETMNCKAGRTKLSPVKYVAARNRDGKAVGTSCDSNVDSKMSYEVLSETSGTTATSSSAADSLIRKLGCSRVEKKKKVKKCLDELIGLLGSDSSPDTLNVLQSLLDEFKKGSQEKDSSKNLTPESSSSCIYLPEERYPADSSRGYTSEENGDYSKALKKTYTIKVAKKDYTVVDISTDLLQNSQWKRENVIGRQMKEFVFEKDFDEFMGKLQRLANRKSYSDGNIFVRLLFPVHKYLHRRPFEVFSVSVHLENSVSDSFELANPVSEIFLKTTLIEPISTNLCKKGLPVNKCKFKHCLDGKLTYIEESAVQLLGYLPQNVCDTCLVDYVHPDDYDHLLNLYETLVDKQGNAVHSCALRLRVQNGDYITVEIQLCCFLKSSIIDFISGTIIVLQGPSNWDIFAEVDEAITADSYRAKEVKQSIQEKLYQFQAELEGHDDNQGDLSDQKSGSRDTTNQNSSGTGTSSLMLSNLTDKEANKAYVSMTFFSSIQRFLERDSRMKLEQLSDNFESEDNKQDGESVTELQTCYGALSSSDSVNTNSSMHAVLPEEDLDPSNQSPPFGTHWPHQQAAKAPTSDSGHVSMETSSCSQHNLSPSRPDLKELTVENLVKHQLNERKKYLKSIQSNKELRRLYTKINATVKSVHTVKKRKLSHKKDERHAETETNSKLMKTYSGKPVNPPVTAVADPPFRVTCLDSLRTFSVPYAGINPQVRHMFMNDNSQAMARFSFMPRHPVAFDTCGVPPVPGSSIPFRFGVRQHAPSHSNRGFISQQPTGGYFGGCPGSSYLPVRPSCVERNTAEVPVARFEGCDVPAMPSTTNEEVMDYSAPLSNPNNTQPMEGSEEDSDSDWFLTEHSGESASDKKSVSQPSEGRRIDFEESCPTPSPIVNPYWLETVPNHEEMNDYVVKLEEGVEENFLEQLKHLNQSRQVLTQVMQHELDKIDMDLDKESDNSSLFTPFKGKDLNSKWENIVAHQKGRVTRKDRHSKVRGGQWSSTDSVPETDGSFEAIYLSSDAVTKRRRGKYSSYISSKKRHNYNLAKQLTKSRQKLVDNVKKWKSDMNSKKGESSKDLLSLCPSIKFGQKGGTKTSSHSSEGSKEKNASVTGYEASEESIGITNSPSGDDEHLYYNNQLATLRQEAEYQDKVVEDLGGGINPVFDNSVMGERRAQNAKETATRNAEIYNDMLMKKDILDGAELEMKQADSGFQSSTCSFQTEKNNDGNSVNRYASHHHNLAAMRLSNKTLTGGSHDKKTFSAIDCSSGIDSISTGSTSSGCKCSGSGSEEQCVKCSKPISTVNKLYEAESSVNSKAVMAPI